MWPLVRSNQNCIYLNYPQKICLGALVPKLKSRRAERVTNVGIVFKVHDAVKQSGAGNISVFTPPENQYYS